MTPEQLASIQSWLQYVPMIATALLFAVIVWAVSHIFRSPENDLEWSQLISLRNIDGKQKASWDPIGKGGGVIVCVAIPFIYVFSPNVEPFGLAAIMAAALLYLGAVSAYSATLRAKQGSVETTKVIDDHPVSRTTETTIQTPPIESVAP